MSDFNEPLDYVMKASDFVFSVLPTPMPKKNQVESAKVVAHRGFHKEGVKENTLAAFDRCVEANIWGIELDVRWTKDLVPVVHHDSNTFRVFKKDYEISLITFEELRKKVPEIPTVSEVVERYKKKIHFMIELKNDETFVGHPFKEKVEQFNQFLKILDPLTPIEDYHLMSLDPSLFTYLKNVPNGVFLPIAQFNEKDLLEQVIDQDWGGLTGHYLTLLPKYRKKLKINNKALGVGFVDSFSLLKRELKKNTDWIFTNNPVYISECLVQLLSVFKK